MDQDKALAWTREQRKVCQCGTRASEWEADRFAYVGQQRHCPGCELIDMEKENIPEGSKGMSVYLAKASEAKTPEEEGSET